jgi:hypothetical protein
MARSSTSWGAGVSGNPAGRQKGGPSDLLKAVRRRASENAEALAERLIQLAMNGDIRAMRVVLAYCDGLPTQMIEVSSSDGQFTPVVFLPHNGRDFTAPLPNEAELQKMLDEQ